MTIVAVEQMQEAVKYACAHSDPTLLQCISRLKYTEENINKRRTEQNLPPVNTEIYFDYSPFSFYFVRISGPNRDFDGNGGIIFHGQHDGFGSGAYLTSVCLTPTKGWSIHT